MATAQKENHNQSHLEQAKDVAKDVAGDVATRTRDIGAAVAQKAGEATAFVGKKADDAMAAVGAGMKSVAGTIRDKAPDKGVMGAAGSAVADTIEQGGRYLQEHGLSGMSTEVTRLIQRNPIPAVLLSIGLGYLVARALTPRS